MSRPPNAQRQSTFRYPNMPPMAITTQAYVARSGNHLNINLETIHYPTLGPHEILLDIVAASLCHTDVRAAQGTFLVKPPLILGHEASGYVREVGSEVTYVQPGDAVITSFASCGECRMCMRGKAAYCDGISELNFRGRRRVEEAGASGGLHGEVVVRDEEGGEVKALFFGQSSLARCALVREESCVRIDAEEEVSRAELRMFASLGCGIQTGAGAIMNVARPVKGSSIAVFGGGAVGLSAIMAARLSHPACLVLVDNSQAKLDMIPKVLLEGVHVVNSADKSPEDVAAELKRLSPNGAGMDFALDCVGNEAVILAAHAALDKLGMLLNVGSGTLGTTAKFTIAKHLIQGATSRGTHQGDSNPRIMIPHLIQLWRQDLFPFDKLLTTFEFAKLHDALDAVHAGKVIKPLLVV